MTVENIEKKIVSLVSKLSEGRNRLLRLHIQIVGVQNTLGNLIEDYKKHTNDYEIDMLFAAIVDDHALDQRDIKIVFDYNEKQYREALKRYFERRQNGSV